MPRSNRTSLIWILSSLLAVGCDPVRSTVQLVRLQLIDSATKQPVVSAQLLLLQHFLEHPLSETQLTSEEWRHYQRLWDQARWFRGVTDEDGKAYIIVEYTALDRSRESRPPADRDWVTGKPFIVRVVNGQKPEERMSLVMEPGESAQKGTVTVTVLKIQGPWYVDQIIGWRATTIILWLFVINLGIAFGAGLYEARIVVPQWFEFSQETGFRWNAIAARQADVGRRFWVSITTVPLTLLTLANLVVLWWTPDSVYYWWLVAEVVVLIERVTTFTYFIPTMIDLTRVGALGTSEATTLSRRWLYLGYVRQVAMLIGWLTALKALSNLSQISG
jgi:hypothetical protein